MAPRWKGKGSEAKALADPMSKIILQLQSSLIESDVGGLLSGCSVLLAVKPEEAELLNHACFGRQIVTAEKDRQWIQLGMEEAFYLCYALKCIKVSVEDCEARNDEELWHYMKTKEAKFPFFYKAYSHLRKKNWVVRSGLQYGVDFVAYRHHPSLVHSEFAVLIISDGDDEVNERLRVWSDIHCTVRLCGSVAKTLLVLHINKNGHDVVSPTCLDNYTVEERTITRWTPERCREDRAAVENGTK
ncbi:tRNA-splicing endonuclease subunit Sen2-1-like isoform X2 [Carica papaya]|nr:tRNA-splicing endonuclease subunit Sen2-1-like isoform X2 [Carica papaya]XP_021912182.1 tRNA-splicing endonuclease subunit Sen2-1-like isoform X2 [Carica papaya]XP_021912183.1 tRNA-splicing endonuclease subunit Sen2-1-like isoform X2 [Carica papaya]XP_021912184.1 tRNA-splicing endonuclease subunit Sen2-1-like isoform X2 [Carica papaya]XP_021912185.1 tRNA-splicing endonuclease subunit Sen2-1-like isoform X2 [Carica papaya]XP_021912186.1 tRNA-splicing endonuclease subunit Sen2-1-like isoform 